MSSLYHVRGSQVHADHSFWLEENADVFFLCEVPIDLTGQALSDHRGTGKYMTHGPECPHLYAEDAGPS